MIKSRTVFIVGAGASNEIGLPLGRQLRNEIAAMTDYRTGHSSGDKDLRRVFSQTYGGKQTDDAASEINNGIPHYKSVDDFLYSRQGSELVLLLTKACIVKKILENERGSFLCFQRSNTANNVDFSRLKDTWYPNLMEMLPPEASSDPGELFRNISFVVFNYDRCLEFYLLNAMRGRFGLSYENAWKAVKAIRIHHPYGAIGELPDRWSDDHVWFGGTGSENFIELATNIKTYSEEMDRNSGLVAMHGWLTAAQTIVFLGFHFHEVNLEILKPPSFINANRLFGSAYSISDYDQREVKRNLSKIFAPDLGPEIRNGEIAQLQNKKCCDLFRHYQFSLEA